MVGDPGIEPGAGRPGGVTVPCRTLQLVAHTLAAGIDEGSDAVKGDICAFCLASGPHAREMGAAQRRGRTMSGTTKPTWIVDKERAKRAEARETVWLFGLHAVRDALMNPAREKVRLVLTKNALDKLAEAVAASGMEPEMTDPRHFNVPIAEDSVHQGAALEARPLQWGKLEDVCISGQGAPLVVCLDRVTDPHNVGAVLRSAEVFGARAVIAPRHHSAPETGALAKTASGALERQPYLRVTNLADAMGSLREMGYVLIGLDGDGTVTLAEALANAGSRAVALVLGAEGPGLRDKTRETCDVVAKIPFQGAFGSLNVSNAAAVGLYAASTR
jgi:23S rRNA (guanosine2251-2'-O)-methyltransferase